MKVGIISLFYNSTNYGGVLQAYALAKFLNSELSVDARQICYNDSVGFSINRIVKIFNVKKLCRFVKNKIGKNVRIVADANEKRYKPFCLLKKMFQVQLKFIIATQ